MRTGSVVLLGVLLLGGCGDRSADGFQPVVRDSAGIRVIDLPPPSESPPDVVLALDGHWIGGRGQEFGELEDVGVLQDGRVVLLDGLSARLTVLDADVDTPGNEFPGFLTHCSEPTVSAGLTAAPQAFCVSDRPAATSCVVPDASAR